MRHLKILCMALVAVLAVGLTAVASASAHEFVASKSGLLKIASNKVQLFTTPAGKVECSTVELQEGEAKEGSQASILVGALYLGCKVLTPISITATISLAKYLFLASGLVHLENLVKIVAPFCEISVPAQNNLEDVAFLNTPANDITLDPLVSGIVSTASGSACGATGLSSTGTYTGSSVTELVGGSIEWK